MAENESLDIANRRSRRWRELRDMIRTGETNEEIAAILRDNLYKTFKRVVEQIPLKALLEALLNRQDVRGILRECDNHEYAQLVAKQYEARSSSFDIMERTLRATVDRFLDQIEIAVVGSATWPDVLAFEHAKETWRTQIRAGVRELAGKLAAHPEQRPRLPRRTAEQKREASASLLSTSLLTNNGARHGQI